MQALPAVFYTGKSQMGQGAESQVINPASEAVIGTFQDASLEQVDAVVRAARQGFDGGAWSRASVEHRQSTMRSIADAIEQNALDLASLETSNTGILLRDTRDRHVKRAAFNFRFFADYIGQRGGDFYEQDPNYLTFVRSHPVGVAALIAPWNAPIALGSMKIAAAIAFGNSCVIKPSEQTPLSTLRLIELMHEAGLPENVVNMVSGRGQSVGDALVRHPEVNVVSFTGGTATGRAIMSAAGEGLKASTMELGGKSANVIFDDADLDQALNGALIGIFANNGQQCLAGSRILVQESIADEFIAAFTARAKNIRVGDPLSDETEIGPIASAAHRDRILSFVETAQAEGAEVLTGGDRPAHLDTGFYINPIAVRAPSNGIKACQDEIFGPFASFLTFKDEAEAFAIANDTRFGLVSYVWSENINRIMAAQEALMSGVVWVNTPMMRELRAPFGGYGDSGVGAEGGKACEALYSREKTVTIPREKLNLPKLGG